MSSFLEATAYATYFFFLDVIHVHVIQRHEKNVITNELLTRPIIG